MGSTYFFQCYSDFKSKDIDMIEIVDDPNVKNVAILRGQGLDYYYFKRRSKEQWIKDALNSKLALFICKFLIPEFNNLIGFTIEDLPLLYPQIEKLDEKHSYVKIIFDSYIKNKSFTLTDEQRLEAYKEYKRTRIKYYKEESK